MPTSPPTIPTLPAAPSSTSPATFDAAADAHVAALPGFVSATNAVGSNVYANAVEAASSATTASTAASTATGAATTALNAPGTQATTATSITIATGSVALTLGQTGKAFAVGQWALIADTAAPSTRWLAGGITAFNSGTGAMTVNVAYISGSGSGTSWAVTPTSPTTGFPGTRNRVINGDMRVAQRGASGTASAGLSYALDRWMVGYGGTAPTWAQSAAAIAGVNQSANFLQVTGTAATAVFMRQRIESANCRDMAGQSVTLSWYAYQTTGSTMSVTSAMSYATATDDFTATTGISTSGVTLVPNATFTLVTAQFTIPAAATKGLEVNLYANTPALSGGATLNAAMVQLEVGSVVTPFEQRPYGMELALCQRYFFAGRLFIGSSVSYLALPVQMRAAMSAATITGGGAGFSVADGSSAAGIICSQTVGSGQSITVSTEL